MTAPSSQRYVYSITNDFSKPARTLAAHQDVGKVTLADLEALRSLRAKAWMARRPKVEFSASAVEQIEPWNIDGEPIDPAHIPRTFHFRKSLPRIVPHFSFVRISAVFNAVIVSRAWKMAIENIEPERHEFHEVNLSCADGRVIEPHYLSREQVKLAAIDPVRSGLKKVLVRDGVTLWAPSVGHSFSIQDSLVISADAVEGRHYWKDEVLPSAFASEELLGSLRPLLPRWLQAIRQHVS